ncbi:MAG: LPS export ABC transporter ATP-binding protein [Oligoflexia bacterium]|nr:LPS export ABC transporter ATP-binding protein [Oligoflexia bacterium]
MNVLAIDNISKSFKKRKVVDGVSFEVRAGEIVGLLGPNGAGKTTSFYMVVGLVKPDTGDIFVNGASIGQKPMYERARLGVSYLPQEPSVFRRLSVEDNIMVALEAHGYGSSERAERLEDLLDDLKIHHVSKSYAYALSGGERRRVEIARALAGEPKFLLLDEPFAGIDPIAVGDIQAIVKQLKERNIGVLITDHNVRETLRICDRGYILKEGRIQVTGTAEEIAESPVARKFYLGENFKI